MNKLVLIFFCLVFTNSVFSQRKLGLGGGVGLPQRGADNGQFSRDSLSGKPSRKAVKNEEAKIQDYLIITRENDTIQVDTTLSINKDYKFNYLRRDDFELLPFSNMGLSDRGRIFTFQNKIQYFRSKKLRFLRFRLEYMKCL